MLFEAKLLTPHFRCVIYSALLRLCREKYPHVDLERLCQEAGLSLAYLEDDSNWVSIIFANRFTKLLKEATGNPKISFDGGNQSLDQALIGRPLFALFTHISSRMFTTSFLYGSLPELTSRFSAITRLKVLKRSSRSITYHFRLETSSLDKEEKENLKELYDEILLNTIGYYTTVASWQKLPPPQIEVREMEGAESEFPEQEIQIQWSDRAEKHVFLMLSLPTLGGLCAFVVSLLSLSVAEATIVGLSTSFLSLFLLFLRHLSTSRETFDSILKALKESEERYADVLQSHQRIKRLSETYKKFVAPRILSRLRIKDYEDLRLGLTSQEKGTALFCDIRNFTQLSEKKSESEIFSVLNAYYAMINQIVDRTGGYIDSYAGDGFFAVFPEGPQSALEASHLILKTLEEFNQSFSHSYLRLRVGIGMATGQMLLGTIGDEHRMQVTHISDVVNLASRLESLTKDFQSDIVIDEATCLALPESLKAKARSLGEVKVRGRETGLLLWALLAQDLSDPAPSLLAQKLN